MCRECPPVVNNAAKKGRKKYRPSPAKMDPTRTTDLRLQFVKQMDRRFKNLKKAIQQKLVSEDALGLTEKATHVVFNRAEWKFLTSPEKITAFKAWLVQMIDKGILELPEGGGDPRRPWTSQYINSAHRRGVVRAYVDARPHLRDTQGDQFKGDGFVAGTQAEFLIQAFAQPEMTSKLALLSTRTFEQLKGISADMASKLSVTLAQGLAEGRNPTVIARMILANVDGIEAKRALTLARTEVIHAHAEGQLDGFEALGVEELGILAEWLTAGDNRVCPQCRNLEGVVFTVKEARGLLPRHPNCRCAWIPAFDDRLEANQKRRGENINRAVGRSVKEERPNSKDPRKDSSWAGAKRTFSDKPVKNQLEIRNRVLQLPRYYDWMKKLLTEN